MQIKCTITELLSRITEFSLKEKIVNCYDVFLLGLLLGPLRILKQIAYKCSLNGIVDTSNNNNNNNRNIISTFPWPQVQLCKLNKNLIYGIYCICINISI